LVNNALTIWSQKARQPQCGPTNCGAEPGNNLRRTPAFADAPHPSGDLWRNGMQVWQQNYDPLNNLWLSSLVAVIPIVFFFFALIKLKLKGYQAGTITVVLALLVALLLYGMPVPQALASVAYGFYTACGRLPGSSWRRYLSTRSR
jgi:L-lactate permease